MELLNRDGEWDRYRKDARNIENELEKKLSFLSKLGSNYGNKGTGDSQRDPDQEPLLGDDNEYQFNTISMEIEALLNKLTTINSNMCTFCDTHPSPGVTLRHTLQRHQEILHDYHQEFNKMASNIHTALQRSQLLGSFSKNLPKSKNSPEVSKRSDLYVKEYDHIRNSSHMIDEQLNIAMKTKEELHNQRMAFKSMQANLITLSNKFPALNSLIQRVNLKKKKDSIILGTVIAVCLILIIVYIFH